MMYYNINILAFFICVLKCTRFDKIVLNSNVNYIKFHCYVEIYFEQNVF